MRRCFGLRTAIATALPDNPVGRLVEDLVLQGGVATALPEMGSLRRRGAHGA
jgi:2-dehydro-3-deoxygluconokinase